MMKMSSSDREKEKLVDGEEDSPENKFYKEAFDNFDWNNSGTIPCKELQYAMRRAGSNPTDVEVQDMINKIDDGSGTLDFHDFALVMGEKTKEVDLETHFKDTFRVFSKDEEGCIPADEMKFVLKHLPGKVTYKEIDEMIHTVDKNGDGKISFSEFRVMMGAFPMYIPDNPVAKKPDKDKDKPEEEVLARPPPRK